MDSIFLLLATGMWFKRLHVITFLELCVNGLKGMNDILCYPVLVCIVYNQDDFLIVLTDVCMFVSKDIMWYGIGDTIVVIFLDSFF